MGCSDIFCIICGLSYSNWYMKEQGLDKEETNWLDNCTILTLDDKVISNCENADCYSQFGKSGTSITFEAYGYFQSDNITDHWKNLINSILGSFLHTDCWKFIEKEYGIKLKYSMIPFMLNIKKKKVNCYHPVLLDHINYGPVEKYWGQDFNFEKLIQDQNQYMYLSPLIDKKNAQRIKKIISQMKLKKEDRKGPQISSTWYSDNTYRMGNDYMIWYTKNNKWNQLKIKLNMTKIFLSYKDTKNKNVKKLYTILNKIRQIGQDSKDPIFLNNLLKYYDPNKKLNYIFVQIISSSELCNKVFEQIKKLKSIIIY